MICCEEIIKRKSAIFFSVRLQRFVTWFHFNWFSQLWEWIFKKNIFRNSMLTVNFGIPLKVGYVFLFFQDLHDL